ncbi:RNA polymerase sigma factor [Dokdonella koreensis]|uniref:RNA polymerase sigma factor n=1 Tax=Dokdonella koreensis TaxID=323415 RepID=UPI000836E728|nr:RNA polymerase sigma factor [Dokdonella koreensis]
MSREPSTPVGAASRVPFDRFVDERRGPLQRFLVNLGVGSEDAKDLVQEGFLRLLRYRDTTPPDEWTPLAYRIVLNLHRDRQRQAATRETPLFDTDDDLSTHASPEPSPEHLATDQQHLMLARQAILELPPRCREVYLLNRVDALSYPAIAARCGISVKAVEKHISRALRELRGKVDRLLASRGTP